MGSTLVARRRPFAAVAGLIAVSLLALGLLGSPATGSPHKPKCPKGNEKAGCKLPVGAIYRATTQRRSATGLIEVSIQKGRVGAILQSVYVDCTKFSTQNGDETGLAANYHMNGGAFKVGKTYVIHDTVSEPATEESPSFASTSTITLNFKTAKQAIISVHYVDSLDGVLQCDGKLPPTKLKRDPGT